MKDKKMMPLLMITGIVIIAFILIMVIISAVSGKRLTYEKVENKLLSAAESYYKTRENELPQQNGASVAVSAETLATAKKMKSLNKIVPKGANCSGKVIVTKNGEYYLYSPILECGTEYSSKKLTNVVTDRDNIVISGEGLYAKDNGYIFKGKKVNNLVKLGDTLWAIMDIDNDGYMRLISVSSNKKARTAWDTNYNVNEKASNGINEYYSGNRISDIRGVLVDYETSEYYLTVDTKKYVTPRKWCIGKRSETNININTTEECSVLSEEQMFGLPYVSDAFMASTDPDCHTINDASCDNYNYLSSYALSSWTLTGVSESTSKVYYVVSAGVVSAKASSSRNIMPTVYLSNNVIYASGDGSIESPYILK